MDTNAIKARLQELKKEIEARMDKTRDHIRHVDGPVEQDFEEQAVSRKNDDVIYQLDSRGRDDLAQINNALRRIERGTYFVCKRCGEEIEPERLQALPYTDQCRNCAG